MGPVMLWGPSVYERFEVEGFRCFENLKLRDLARINLIAGVNNVGKTALLEAIFIDSGWRNPSMQQRRLGTRFSRILTLLGTSFSEHISKMLVYMSLK
jgi:AAA15 family ATPase/GTPase